MKSEAEKQVETSALAKTKSEIRTENEIKIRQLKRELTKEMEKNVRDFEHGGFDMVYWWFRPV